MTKPTKSASLLDLFEISKDYEKNPCLENYTYIRRHILNGYYIRLKIYYLN